MLQSTSRVVTLYTNIDLTYFFLNIYYLNFKYLVAKKEKII